MGVSGRNLEWMMTIINKTITIEDDETALIVMNAIAKVAKGFDNCIEDYANDELIGVTDKTIQEWQSSSDRLWAIVRQFSKGHDG